MSNQAAKGVRLARLFMPNTPSAAVGYRIRRCEGAAARLAEFAARLDLGTQPALVRRKLHGHTRSQSLGGRWLLDSHEL